MCNMPDRLLYLFRQPPAAACCPNVAPHILYMLLRLLRQVVHRAIKGR